MKFGALLDINKISFPGLGIGEFEVNEVAFSVFGKNVAWYGIIVTLAIAAVCAYVYFRAVKFGYKVDDILDYFIFSIIFGIIGARTYYIIFHGIDRYIVSDGNFWHNVSETLYNLAAVWEGGIAIYGGIIAIVITIFVVSKIKKLPFSVMLDLGGHGAMLGQAIGRWGNFVNAEAHGGETDIFCRMGLTDVFGITTCYHPTFLYESLWNITGFILISTQLKRQKYKGQIFIYYCAWYGFGRMLIEGLRTDSLYIGNTGIRVSQLLGFVLFATGTVLAVVLSVKYKNATHEDYISEIKAAVCGNVTDASSGVECEDADETEHGEDNAAQDQETEKENDQ